MAHDVKLRLDGDEESSSFITEPKDVIPIAPISSVSGIKIDITRIAEYSRKIEHIGQGFNKMTAPLYIRDFSIAYDITSNMLFEVTRKDMDADNKLQFAESIAYLENASAYLSARDIKDTAEARKRYVPTDPGVQHALAVKAETAALMIFLKTKLQEFKMAIESVKKIAYGDMYMSPDEGM